MLRACLSVLRSALGYAPCFVLLVLTEEGFDKAFLVMAALNARFCMLGRSLDMQYYLNKSLVINEC